MANAYIINSFRVPKVVNDYVHLELLKDYDKSTKEFFVHVLFGTLHTIKREEEGWVPVSSELIKKEWGRLKPDWRKLKEANLIEVKVFGEDEQDYSKVRGLSREFRVDLQLAQHIVYKFPHTTKEFANCEYYNLMTGYKMREFKRHKFSVSQDSKNSIPKLIKDSILSIESCIVNDTAIMNHINELFADAFWSGKTSTENYRYINNKHCYDSLRQTNIVILDKNLIEYHPSYKVQMSGRISEEGGGMQSCTREMKAAAFSNIPGIRNYDLKSSQVYGLIQWFEFANIDSSWLHTYLSKSKSDYANVVGISVDCWKSCFLSLVMNAYLPNEVKKDMCSEDISILNYLLQEAKGNEELAFKYYFKFYEVVQPLLKSLDKWKDWLIKKYIPMTAITTYGKQYLANRTGMTLCITDFKTDKGKWKNLTKFKRKLCAFVLQGGEASFIHHLTIISKQYSYKCLNNQHDGLIVIGEIPQEAIDYAREESGLKYAILEEKPFI